MAILQIYQRLNIVFLWSCNKVPGWDAAVEISQSPQLKYEFTDFPITVIFLQYSFNATYPQNLRERLLRHDRSPLRQRRISRHHED